ncbi:MAG: Phosphomannomutase [Gammaproteobacteria bacterium]|jgi:phosphomannomutase/phosphoglucomutase|nr:Phosphomannomutase [Gammaproteobacteria bacterium]
MPYALPARLAHEIFRAYDIRGIVETELTENTVYAIGLAFGSLLREKGETHIHIGRDGRLTGLGLMEALASGLQTTGCDVIDIGPVPTAVLYYACAEGKTSNGIIVTGSHNPSEYNGLKMLVGGRTLVEEQIRSLYQRIQQRDFYHSTTTGSRTQQSFDEAYLARINRDIHIKRKLKVVIDCGNGITGGLAPVLFKQLLAPAGGDLSCLYETVDGTFPNHHPDPSIPDNLSDLIEAVKQQKADIGLAFDGDGDRLGVVTNTGEIIWPDRQMMLFSKDVLSRNPQGTVIFDVKCSKHLASVIERHHGKPVMWKTGHSLIKNKLAETSAVLAGEMSGHIFFKERWYGFDDGMYCGARLLEILSQHKGSADALFSDIPNSVNTPELKLPMSEDKKFDFMKRLAENAHFPKARLITIDGLRVEFEEGWGLIRPSNTTPYLVLRFEADNEKVLAEIMRCFSEQLLQIDPALILPVEMQSSMRM